MEKAIKNPQGNRADRASDILFIPLNSELINAVFFQRIGFADLFYGVAETHSCFDFLLDERKNFFVAQSRLNGIAFDDDDHFAFDRGKIEVNEFAERTAQVFFVEFGDFPGNAGFSVSEYMKEVLHRRSDAMRRFIKNHRFRFVFYFFDFPDPFAFFRRKKSVKIEMVGAKPRTDQSGDEGVSAVDDRNGDVVFDAMPDKDRAGIGNSGIARVAGQSGFFIRFQHCDDLFARLLFIVLMTGNEGFLDTEGF